MSKFTIKKATVRVDGMYDFALIDEEGRVAAEVFGRTGKDSFQEAETLALLLAAAPDLLAVAKLILKEWEADHAGLRNGALVARLSQFASEARAAVKKAEGK